MPLVAISNPIVYTHIDIFRYKDPLSRRAIAKGDEQMDAVQARLGHSDHILLT